MGFFYIVVLVSHAQTIDIDAIVIGQERKIWRIHIFIVNTSNIPHRKFT